MGYYSHITGTIRFSPRLRQPAEPGEVADERSTEHDSYDLRLVTESEDHQVEIDGVEETVTATYFVAIEAPEESGKYYDFATMLQTTADYCSTLTDAGLTFDGHMERTGEETMDAERFYLNAAGKVVSVTPEVIWPEPNLDG